MEVEDMINKRRFLRSKGGENGRCHPEQSGVMSHLAGGGMTSHLQQVGTVAMVLGLHRDKGKNYP